jgi:ADP-ribose pyrophosphatase YjhB (NUDIX family)
MRDEERIWVKAFCLFFRNEEREVLLIDAKTPEGRPWHKPLGGTVEHLELSTDAATREVKEETGFAVRSLRLLNVLENLFELDARTIHEIVFLYRGEFADETPYRQDLLRCVEADGSKFTAVWTKVDVLRLGDRVFYPSVLREVLLK